MNQKNLQKAGTYIESWIDFNFPFSRMPGLVVTIQQGNKILLQKAWGMANIEKKIPMRTDHLFRIASHSKLFTAVAIMQLVEKGKVRLKEPLATYLPFLNKTKDARYKTITVEQVLAHAAGIIRDGNKAGYWDLEYPFPSKQELIKEIQNTKLVFSPNKRFKYSNFGFSLLGYLIEEVSGVSYNSYIQKHIFDPLNMHTAGTDIHTESPKNQFAVGYTKENKDLTRTALQNPSTEGMASATGLYSTAEDLCKFARIFYEKTPVLSEKSRRQILRKHWDADLKDHAYLYGLGCDRRKMGSRWYIGHGGGFPGFITRTSVDVENKLTVVVLRNSLGDPMLVDKILKLIQFFDTTKKPSKKADSYEGRYEYMWGVFDILNIGTKLLRFSPTRWGMPDEPSELKRIRTDEYIIEDNDGYGSVGEHVTFAYKNGKVSSIEIAGSKIPRTPIF